MSAVGITLDLLLGALLLAAIFVGVRLERRLKALRQGQADFAKAVSELNSAATRAEAGLADVRAVTLQAQTTLADRTQDARAAAARLEQQAASAIAAAQRLETASQRAPAPPLRAPIERAPAAAPVREELVTPLRRAALSRTRPEPDAAPAASWIPSVTHAPASGSRRTPAYEEPLALLTPVGPRSRSRIDDDLFETAPSAAGGRR